MFSQLIIIPVVVALERMNYWSILCTLASILKREERVHELFVLPLSSPLPLIPFSSAPSFSPLSSSDLLPFASSLPQSFILFCLHPSPLFFSLCISLNLLSSSSIRAASLPPNRFPHEGLGHAAEAGGLTWAGGMQGKKSQSCCCDASQSPSAAQCCRLMMQQDFLKQRTSADDCVLFVTLTVCKDDWDQAAWVISLDALNWFSRRRCREKRSREWYFHFLTSYLISPISYVYIK